MPQRRESVVASARLIGEELIRVLRNRLIERSEMKRKEELIRFFDRMSRRASGSSPNSSLMRFVAPKSVINFFSGISGKGHSE